MSATSRSSRLFSPMGKQHKPGARQVSDDIGAKDLHPKTPGKQTEPQTGPTGDVYVDHGSFKDPKAFLTPDQRTRLTNAFQHRTLVAQSNYQDAAGDVRVDKLLEKDEDLPWLASMMIDLALGFVIGQVAKSVIAFRDAKLEKVRSYLGDQAERIAMGLADDDKLNLKQRVSLAFGKLSDDHIKTSLQTVGAIGKKLAGNRFDAARSGAKQRQESLNYLDQLRSAAGIAFQKFREATPALAGDAELVALFHAMDVDNHQIDAYKLAIEDKIKRYEASSVNKIGRENDVRWSDDGRRSHRTKIIRDVWVRWLRYESGHPQQLVFMYEEGQHTEKDESPTNGQAYLGQTHRKRELSEPEKAGAGVGPWAGSKYIVPDEFVETAVMRHKQKWGTDPEIVHIDDSDAMYFGADRAKKAQENKAKKTAVPRMQLSR